jgi:glutathione synthase/RimK-type ligase-like ATP-grasp enzyme
MSALLVIENPEECPLDFSGVDTVAARSYLAEESFSATRSVKVFNICRSFRYQSIGYYVSLLAEARGHKPVPTITTIQDMKSVGIIRLASDELDEWIQKQFAGESAQKVSINIYFGKSPQKQFEPLASRLFKFFPAPFLRADFSASPSWQLQNVSPLFVKEIPESERDVAERTAREFVSGRKIVTPRRVFSRYDVAILADPAEKHPPSDARALKNFIKAADFLGIGTELITRDDSRRLSEFDALFIRETTNVDHHTYRMARKAVAEGLVVIDDPVSILRCSNKVYLAELLQRHRVATPKTLIVHSNNLDRLLSEFNLPCVLKEPDSSFSQGVVLISTAEQLSAQAARLLKKSDLFIAQEYLPTDFDWRIGVLDRRPLFACKYFMAKKHWQVIDHRESGKIVEGKWETLPVSKAPRAVVATALKAAHLIGDGLYGVDLKQVGNRVVVMEVNDNPNIESDVEDDVLGEELYLRIMQVFLQRIDAMKSGGKSS